MGRPRCLRTRTWSAVPAARHHRKRPAPPAVVPRVAAGPSARWLALASWRLALLPHWTAARAAVVGYSRSSQPPAPRFPLPRAAGTLSLAGFVRHQDSTHGGPQKHRSQLNKKKSRGQLFRNEEGRTWRTQEPTRGRTARSRWRASRRQGTRRQVLQWRTEAPRPMDQRSRAVRRAARRTQPRPARRPRRL